MLSPINQISNNTLPAMPPKVWCKTRIAHPIMLLSQSRPYILYPINDGRPHVEVIEQISPW